MKKYIRKYVSYSMRIKIALYKKFLSTNKLQKYPKLFAPTLFLGAGTIIIDDDVQLGYNPSPFFYSNYNHIEARTKSAIISIGAGTIINNNATLISGGAGITIGKKCLIGPSLEIYDTDFHEIDPALRYIQQPVPQQVIIEDNVFIGSGVKILKGVTIGKNCVIGAGSVVAKSFPDNSIIAGNPAKKIKDLA